MKCTCNINNIKDMSPAFVNRFNVIVLENQLENLSDEQFKDLICLFLFQEFLKQKEKKILI